jgi:U3 small nucleolar RNA-associated protein 24
MGKQARNARSRFAVMKKMVQMEDPRIRWKQGEKEVMVKRGLLNKSALDKNKKNKDEVEVKKLRPVNPHMFFKYNTALGPPYHILVDTNFLNFSIQNKLDVISGGMDCLYGKCVPCVTDCVMAELEKLGFKYRLALRLAKDPRFERLPCSHKGTYADDCIINRVKMNNCYIVATCDKDLKRRLRRVPGVPLMSIKSRKYTVERMPDALGDSMKVK